MQVYLNRQPGLLEWQVDVGVPDLGRPGTADFMTRHALPRELVVRDGPFREAADRVRLIRQLCAAALSRKEILELLPRVVNGRATPEPLSGLSVERVVSRADRAIR